MKVFLSIPTTFSTVSPMCSELARLIRLAGYEPVWSTEAARLENSGYHALRGKIRRAMEACGAVLAVMPEGRPDDRVHFEHGMAFALGKPFLVLKTGIDSPIATACDGIVDDNENALREAFSRYGEPVPASGEAPATEDFPFPAISPHAEVLAYELLWTKRRGLGLGDIQSTLDGRLPSQAGFAADHEKKSAVLEYLEHTVRVSGKNVTIRGTIDFPHSRFASFPLLYYAGNLSLADPSFQRVVVTGCSPDDPDIPALLRMLVDTKHVIVSGCTRQADKNILQKAMDMGGHVIGVMDTPLLWYRDPFLEQLAHHHLLVSHVPYYQYSVQNRLLNTVFAHGNRFVYSALCRDCIIVGSYDQAHIALMGEWLETHGEFTIHAIARNPVAFNGGSAAGMIKDLTSPAGLKLHGGLHGK